MLTEILAQLKSSTMSLKDRMQKNTINHNDSQIESFQPYIISVKSKEILHYVNSQITANSDNQQNFLDKIKFLNEYNVLLVDICKKCYHRFNPTMIYAFNDEIHLVFYNTSDYPDLFNGNLHKTLTTITSYITRLFTKVLPFDLEFTHNTKYISFSKEYEVLNYLVWRQSDCKRNNIITLYQYFEDDIQYKKLEEIDNELANNISKLKEQVYITQILYGNIIKKELVYKSANNDDNDYINRYIMSLEHFNLKNHFCENLVKYIYNKIL